MHGFLLKLVNTFSIYALEFGRFVLVPMRMQWHAWFYVEHLNAVEYIVTYYNNNNNNNNAKLISMIANGFRNNGISGTKMNKSPNAFVCIDSLNITHIWWIFRCIEWICLILKEMRADRERILWIGSWGRVRRIGE